MEEGTEGGKEEVMEGGKEKGRREKGERKMQY